MVVLHNFITRKGAYEIEKLEPGGSKGAVKCISLFKPRVAQRKMSDLGRISIRRSVNNIEHQKCTKEAAELNTKVSTASCKK